MLVTVLTVSVAIHIICWVFVLGLDVRMYPETPAFLFGTRVSHEFAIRLAVCSMAAMAISAISGGGSAALLMVRKFHKRTARSIT